MAEQNDEGRKLLNAVLPNVAAQMRGPLSVLYVGIQRMLQEDMPGAEQMNQSYFQLLRLAANLSAAELMEEDRNPAQMQNSDIVSLCKAICRRVDSLAQEQGITISFESEKANCIIMCNERMIERLLLNLLSNALKFTPEGGHITIAVQVQKRDVLISVADTGCGISEDKMDTLFDRYLHSERMDPMPHGLGMGLPLCHAIAQMHGGRLFAESQVGKGTRVTLALPNKESPIQQVRDPGFDYVGGFDHVLIELSDALKPQAYNLEK